MLSPKEQLFHDAFRRKFFDEPGTFELDFNLAGQFILWADMIIKEDYEKRHQILTLSNDLKKKCAYILINEKEDEELIRLCADMIWRLRKFEAQNRQLDSYLLYLEKNRVPSEKFYQPKRKHFWRMGIIPALQQMLDGELEILTISLPPGTQKTTCEKFFLSGVIGWFPSQFNLFFSHSADITRMFYDGVLNIVTDDLEYTWGEIFPRLKANQQNAKMQQFNVGKYKPFPSVQCTTSGSENAGKVRCNGYLLVDDLIGKLEEALNKNTLDKLWNVYAVDARQRKLDGCKEIHIATRWSVHDVIGRLQLMYEGTDKKCKFIAVPDIDPVTGKSNFDYDYNGFTEEFFHDQELIMDDISYRCLYKQDPVEREGLLYTEDELRTYIDLPAREPDAILGICDTKSKGEDYLFLPCCMQYGEDFYCVDCVCTDSSDYGVQYGRMANLLVDCGVQQCEFESNAGGDRVAYEVSRRVTQMGGRCNITTKPTETNKETRIIVNADWVKKHVLFKDKSLYTPKSDYGVMMKWLLSYSVVGRNKHDDIPDGWANFALYVTNSINRRKTRIMKSPI